MTYLTLRSLNFHFTPIDLVRQVMGLNIIVMLLNWIYFYFAPSETFQWIISKKVIFIEGKCQWEILMSIKWYKEIDRLNQKWFKHFKIKCWLSVYVYFLPHNYDVKVCCILKIETELKELFFFSFLLQWAVTE